MDKAEPKPRSVRRTSSIFSSLDGLGRERVGASERLREDSLRLRLLAVCAEGDLDVRRLGERRATERRFSGMAAAVQLERGKRNVEKSVKAAASWPGRAFCGAADLLFLPSWLDRCRT